MARYDALSRPTVKAMKRRSKAGGKPAKVRRRPALKPKGRSAPKAMPRRGSAPAGQDTEVARLTRELNEALEQQTAVSELLRVMSQSDFELQSTLHGVAQTAARLCRSDGAVIFQLENGVYRFAGGYSLSPAFLEIEQQTVISPGPGTVIGRAAMTRKVARIDDALADQLYEKKEDAKVEGNRSMIGVPLLRDGEPVVVIGLGRRRVDPFDEREIELAATFAAQAVIAIENARLLNELRQRTTDLSERTADLTELLEQQTATSEVLQVVSSSPGDLQPVFDAMLEKAVRICDATFGEVFNVDNGNIRLVAFHNTPVSFVEALKQFATPIRSPTSFGKRLIATKLAIQIADLAADEDYIERNPTVVAAVELGRVRTVLAVPMLKDDVLIGELVLNRQEVRPFTEKQIALVQNFASQAVIAIENARLLTELRESLEEQTATSDVLKVISSSPGDLQPVFAAMLEKAVRICDATFGNIYRWDGDALQLVATHNTPPAYAEHRKHSPFRAEQNNSVAQMITSKKVVHLLDAAANETYATRRDPTVVAAVELGGIRSALIVPMLKEDELVGAFIVSRQEVRPFTEKQIALVTNFAAQAVIAIENARLLTELRERTEEVEKLNEHLESRVADQVDEIERMGRLRRFLPPQVADLIVASGTEKQLESHRREITALFCDLRGFTGFSESADPEDVMALLREYHAAIGEIIVRYSGTLERYAGDGVMVVFNDPIPVDNPALQAVQMALEMRVAIGALTEKWRQLGHEIGFGIGIAHGYATLGTIGFEGRFDYAAIGTVSNVASRLCDEAKPGQILISPRVLMAVKEAVAVESVGEFELKGIRRPIAAYNVLAAASTSA